jgi:hypothetical protein
LDKGYICKTFCAIILPNLNSVEYYFVPLFQKPQKLQKTTCIFTHYMQLFLLFLTARS